MFFQAKWGIDRSWCRKKGHSSSRPSLSKVADFLLDLHLEKKLAPSSTRGYSSMLSLVFRSKLPDVSTTPVISDFLRSFSLSPASGPRVFPSWDVNQVLTYLSGAPFEPLGQASFRNLTKKTLFLVSLATVKCVSELQAISVEVGTSPLPSSDLLLSYLPNFVAKTESESNPIPRSFILKLLKDRVGENEPEKLLCPVRSLRYYLKESRPRGAVRPSNLSISPSRPSHALSKNALSFFLRETISEAIGSGSDGGPSPRAHSIRGMGTSLAFSRNWSVSDVMKAVSWRSNTVFASCYLREVSFSFEDHFTLGPVVAGGQVLGSADEVRSRQT